MKEGAPEELDPELARQVHEAFEELLELDPARRAERLERLPAPVAERVRRLLELSEVDDEFLARPLTAGQLPESFRRDLQAPKVVGDFRLLRELGRGATGSVWLAQQERPRREVALKLLRWEVRDEAGIERFLWEAELLGQVDHPGCAGILGAGVHELEGGERLPWIAMPLVEGRSLGEEARERSTDGILALFAELAEAVHAAHLAGILHRDLKPDNVLVRATGRPVVLDFGVARLITDDGGGLRSQTGQVLGTPAYMSPEQARGERGSVDARSDVYSLGVMLYEALSGELPLPLRGSSVLEALRRVSDQEPVSLRTRRPDLPGDLLLVVDHALARDPDRRYPSARALAADLRAVLEHRPVAARPPSLTYELRRLVRRHPLRILGAALLLIGLVAGLVVTQTLLGRERRTSAMLRVRELEYLAGALWPATPDLLPELEAAVAEARSVEQELARDLERLREEPAALGPSERDALQRLERFLRPDSPRAGLPGLLLRRERASRVREATLVEPAATWAACSARVRADGRFEGFTLEPIEGLVPLGPDPRSGLEQFGVWAWTGDPPRRGVDGELMISDSTGIVLTLIPGGTWTLGMQGDDPGAPFFVPRPWLHCPLREVELDPFLIGTHEVTQGQWIALMGENPSYWAIGKEHSGVTFDGRWPVESVTWDQARAFARRLGLDLPTEAQFEVACRAGTTTAYFTGDKVETLAGHARTNAAPMSRDYRDARGTLHFPGHTIYAPVGIFEPNPWGLFDMTGNVQEWCRDVYWTLSGTPAHHRPGDGLLEYAGPAPEPANSSRSARGGNIHPGGVPGQPAWGSAQLSGMRTDQATNQANFGLGFRVALDLGGHVRH